MPATPFPHGPGVPVEWGLTTGANPVGLNVGRNDAKRTCIAIGIWLRTLFLTLYATMPVSIRDRIRVWIGGSVSQRDGLYSKGRLME